MRQGRHTMAKGAKKVPKLSQVGVNFYTTGGLTPAKIIYVNIYKIIYNMAILANSQGI